MTKTEIAQRIKVIANNSYKDETLLALQRCYAYLK